MFCGEKHQKLQERILHLILSKEGERSHCHLTNIHHMPIRNIQACDSCALWHVQMRKSLIQQLNIRMLFCKIHTTYASKIFLRLCFICIPELHRSNQPNKSKYMYRYRYTRVFIISQNIVNPVLQHSRGISLFSIDHLSL